MVVEQSSALQDALAELLKEEQARVGKKKPAFRLFVMFLLLRRRCGLINIGQNST